MSKNYIAEGAVVKGNVQMGEDVSIWYNATVRGDSAEIKIGDRTNVQDNAVIHVDTHYPTTIGNGVTIGHGAIVHGCTVGDNTLIGMGAIVLNGASIGENCIIGAGALVTQNTNIPALLLAILPKSSAHSRAKKSKVISKTPGTTSLPPKPSLNKTRAKRVNPFHEKPPFSVIKVEKKAEILYNVDNYIHKVEIQ